MKYVLTLLALAFSLNAAAEITFTATNPQQPIKFKVISVHKNGDYLDFYDESGALRLKVFSYATSRSYRYIPSSGTEVLKWTSLSEDELTSLKLFVSALSVKCPIEISIDRQTLKIIDVKAGCDPLAASAFEDNNG